MTALRKQTRGLKVSFDVIIRFREELMHPWPTLLVALLCAIGYTLVRLAEAWPIKFILDNLIMNVPLITPFGWLNDWLGTDRMRVMQLAVSAVLVLDAGQIADRGTHDQLLARPGSYRKLYEMQVSASNTVPVTVPPMMRATS
jgi:hypothetical protein